MGHGISSRAENKKVTHALRPEKLLMSLHKPEEIRASGLQLAQGRGSRHRLSGRPLRLSHPAAIGQNRSGFIANAERHGKRPTWDDQVFLYWKMTAVWCCNHEGIETTATGGGAPAGDRHPFWLFPLPAALHHRREQFGFAEADVAIPPYTDVVSWADNQLTILLNLGNDLLLQEDAASHRGLSGSSR